MERKYRVVYKRGVYKTLGICFEPINKLCTRDKCHIIGSGVNILNPYIVSSLCARTLDFYLAPVGIIERQYCLVLCSAVNLSKSATINRNRYFFWFELNRTEVQNRTKVHKREKKKKI